MKIILLIAGCVICYIHQAFSQTDYVVTKQNDTLYGKIKSIFPGVGIIKLETENGKRTLKPNEYKEYITGGKKFMIATTLSKKERQ